MHKKLIQASKTILCIALLLGVVYFKNDIALAAGSVTIKTVDYQEENIIVNNNGNTKIYFATENDAAKNSWDMIPADVNSDDTTTIDFSWLSPTVEQVLIIKGEDNVQRRVILKPRAKRLEISISYDKMDSLGKSQTIGSLLNIMTTEGTAVNPIIWDDLEWRKGTNGSWKSVSELTVALLEKLQVKGADLYFRIKAVNDNSANPDGTNGRRASGEVRLKIAKQTTTGSISVDGEKFNAQIRYGKEYRVTYNGTTTNWTKITDKSVKAVSFKDMLKNGADGLSPATKFPEMVIEVRDDLPQKSLK